MDGVLVGCGYFARIQMKDWLRLAAHVRLAAVCDLDLARAEAFARYFGVPRVYTDPAAMLDEIRPAFLDAATRPDSHRALVEMAAARRVHVLCQKPFAPSYEDCVAMVETCERAGVRLMVNENWRWQAWYREIARILASGRIGAVRNVVWIHSNSDGLLDPPYPNQPYFAQMPRLLIYETLVHYLDTARFLFGEPARLRCATKRNNRRIAGEDQADIRLEYASGLRVWITGTRCGSVLENGAAMGRMRIDGSRGTLQMMGDGRILLDGHPQAFMPPEAGYKGDSAYATQRHFAECLASGAEFETSGRAYLGTVRLVEAAYQAAAHQGWVPLYVS
jgi:predicted dehydrogenase